MKSSQTFKKKRKINIKKLLIPILSLLVIVAIFISVYTSVFLPWNNVFLEVDKNKITYDEINYQIYLAAKTLNAQLPSLTSSDPKELVAAKNVLQLAYVNTISDTILKNLSEKNNLKVSQTEINNYVNNLKEEIGKDFTNKDLALEDFLITINVSKNSFPKIVEKLLLAKKEEDELTKNISVSEKEVKDFYNDFWTAYTSDQNKKDAYFKENYSLIEKDALTNKKNNYVNQTLRQTLIRDNINLIKVDNPYKKLMRFWYGTFLGTDIPEIYRITNIQDLLT
ncbi:MAG: SurA N-terminal domain-containing protein [Caldisericaceae bacterium]